MVNVDWPTAVAGEADTVSPVSFSLPHILGGPIDVNPGELTLVYGMPFRRKIRCSKKHRVLTDTSPLVVIYF